MARVPGQDVERVPRSPIPGVRVGAEVPEAAFGGGRENAAVYQEAVRIFDEAKGRADQLAVMDAERSMAQEELAIEREVRSKRGRDAIGPAYVEAMQRWQKKSKDVEQTLVGAEQLLAFKRRNEARTFDLDRSLQSHVSAERVKYEAEVTASLDDLTREKIATNFADPGVVEASKLERHSILARHAMATGMSPEQLAQRLLEADSDTYETVIRKALAAGDDGTAVSTWNEHKGDLSAAAFSRLGPEMSLAADRSQAMSAAEKSWDAASLGIKPEVLDAYNEAVKLGAPEADIDAIIRRDVTLRTIYDDAQKLPPGRVRDLFLSEMTRRYNVQKAARKEDQDSALETFLGTLDASPPGTDPRMVPGFTALNPQNQAAMVARAQNKHDPDAYAKFIEKYAPNPAALRALSNADIQSITSVFDEQHRDWAIGWWRQALAARERPGPRSTISDERAITMALEKNNVVDPRWTTKQKRKNGAKVAAFENAYREELARAATAKGSPLSYEEQNAAIARAHFNLDKIEKIETPEKRRVQLGDIPYAEKEDIKAELGRLGRQITNDKVERMYAAYLLRDRFARQRILEEP